jgi:hypothetical protein
MVDTQEGRQLDLGTADRVHPLKGRRSLALVKKEPAIDANQWYICVESFVTDGDFRAVTLGHRIQGAEILDRRLPAMWFVLQSEAQADKDGEDLFLARRRAALRAQSGVN